MCMATFCGAAMAPSLVDGILVLPVRPLQLLRRRGRLVGSVFFLGHTAHLGAFVGVVEVFGPDCGR